MEAYHIVIESNLVIDKFTREREIEREREGDDI